MHPSIQQLHSRASKSNLRPLFSLSSASALSLHPNIPSAPQLLQGKSNFLITVPSDTLPSLPGPHITMATVLGKRSRAASNSSSGSSNSQSLILFFFCLALLSIPNRNQSSLKYHQSGLNRTQSPSSTMRRIKIPKQQSTATRSMNSPNCPQEHHASSKIPSHPRLPVTEMLSPAILPLRGTQLCLLASSSSG